MDPYVRASSERTDRVTGPATGVLANADAAALAAFLTMPAVVADGRPTALASYLALATVETNLGSAAVSAEGALAAVGAIVAFSLYPLSCATLQTRLEASAEAIHLKAILEEAPLAGTFDCLLRVVHCDSLRVSVYLGIAFL